MRYYEDIAVGEIEEFGGRTVTKAEIVEFASKYDPQPFHVDEEAAEDSMFGGIIASGWHTAAIVMRMLADHMMSKDRAGRGARGVDELRWHQPVRPGDTLRARTEIIDKRLSGSDPTRGYVNTRCVGLNQDDEEVISWIGLGMVGRNPENVEG